MKHSEPLDRSDKISILISSFSLVVAVFGTIIGGYFTWQANLKADEANSILTRQATSRVDILDYQIDASLAMPMSTPTSQVAICRHILRLTNFGGASTALVSYTATLIYKNEHVFLETKQAGSRTRPENVLSPRIDYVFITFLKGRNVPPSWAYPAENELSWPAYIPNYSTNDFVVSAQFQLLDDDPKATMWLYASKIPFDRLPNELDGGYSLVRVVYALKTASGEKILTEPIPCIYVK